MSSVLLTSENKESLEQLIQIAQKLKVKVSTLTEDDVLDLGLSKAMKEADNEDFVDISDIMSELQK